MQTLQKYLRILNIILISLGPLIIQFHVFSVTPGIDFPFWAEGMRISGIFASVFWLAASCSIDKAFPVAYNYGLILFALVIPISLSLMNNFDPISSLYAVSQYYYFALAIAFAAFIFQTFRKKWPGFLALSIYIGFFGFVFILPAVWSEIYFIKPEITDISLLPRYIGIVGQGLILSKFIRKELV